MPASVPVAHALGIVPVLWLALRRERRREWWWLASALGVSFLADTVALLAYLRGTSVAPVVSTIYPVGQAALIGAVFLSRADAQGWLGALVLVGLGSLALPDGLLVETVAWLGVAAIAWDHAVGPLRAALLLIFGLGWCAWMVYDAVPAMSTWLAYQSCRALGTGLFCWAQARPVVRLV